MFPHQNLVCTSPLPSTRYMLCASIFLLDLITRKIFGEEYKKLSSSLCASLHSPVTSSVLGPNILLSTIFSSTLSLRSSLNVSYQVSHPYTTRGLGLGLILWYNLGNGKGTWDFIHGTWGAWSLSNCFLYLRCLVSCQDITFTVTESKLTRQIYEGVKEMVKSCSLVFIYFSIFLI